MAAIARACSFGFNAPFHLREAVRVFHIAPQHHLATVTVLCSVSRDARALRHGNLRGLAHVTAALPVAAHQHRTATRCATCFYLAGAGQHNTVAHQHNLAALAGQARGAELATVFNHRALQVSQRVGGQNNLPAFGQHRTAVFYQGCNGLRGCGDACQAGAAAVEGKRNCLGRRKGHRTGLRHHHTLVAHLGCQQGDVAAKSRVELAVVDHTACCAFAVEADFARHEVVCTGTAGGGHQAAHVDLRSGREIDAVGVAQKHLAVRTDLAVDLAGVVAQDLVEHHRAATGLVEQHFGIAADIEAGPVNHRACGGLVDCHQRAPGRRGVGGNGGAATADHATLGKCTGCRWRLLCM